MRGETDKNEAAAGQQHCYHSHQSLEESPGAQSPSEAQEKNHHTQTLPPVSGFYQQGDTSQQRNTVKATSGSNRAHTQPSLETGMRGGTTPKSPRRHLLPYGALSFQPGSTIFCPQLLSNFH